MIRWARKKRTAWLALAAMAFSACCLAADVAEAGRASVRVADREMKKSRDYHPSPIYERARRIIYGMNPPSGPEGRVRIAIVINGDENIIVHDRVKDEIYQQLRKKFPREEFAVMKGSDVKTKLLEMAEEQRIQAISATRGINVVGQNAVSGYEEYSLSFASPIGRPTDIDGLPLQATQPIGISYLKRDDFVRAGRECGYDYLFVATFSNGEADIENHWWLLYNSKTRKKNIWLRLRFVDVENGEYLYRNDIVAQGETGGSSGKPRMMQRAVREAMHEALDDIDVTY